MSVLGNVFEVVNWKLSALCKERPDIDFFAEFDKRDATNLKEAKKVCLACPVRDECLQYAMDNVEDSGIWGGFSSRERRILRRRSKLGNLPRNLNGIPVNLTRVAKRSASNIKH